MQQAMVVEFHDRSQMQLESPFSLVILHLVDRSLFSYLIKLLIS